MSKRHSPTGYSELREEIHRFIDANLPKISSHGSSIGIYEMNAETGYVRLKIAGACTTCPRGPSKVEELTHRLPEQVEWVETSVVEFV